MRDTEEVVVVFVCGVCVREGMKKTLARNGTSAFRDSSLPPSCLALVVHHHHHEQTPLRSHSYSTTTSYINTQVAGRRAGAT